MRAQQRNYGCRIVEFTIHGLRAVALENASLRVGVLADKGADIYEFLYKPRDVDPLWRSPNGIVNPTHGTPSTAAADGAFMDAYEGGWQELFPIHGPAATYYGVPLGEHGEVALLPWEYQIERDDPDEVRVAFQVHTRRSPFRLRRTLTLRGREPRLFIEEEVTNEGAESLNVMWGHHPVVGAPFLEPGCLLATPGGTVNTMRLDGRNHYLPEGTRTPWPLYRAGDGHEEDLRQVPEAGPSAVDELYISDLPEGWYAVTNPRQAVGFALRWQLETFPYLWLWRTLGPAAGFPWYGRTYSLGLEPLSSIPPQYDDALAAGDLLRIDAGETRTTALVAAAFEGTGPATAMREDGAVTVAPGADTDSATR